MIFFRGLAELSAELGALTLLWDLPEGRALTRPSWAGKGSLTLCPQRPEVGMGTVPGPSQGQAGGFLLCFHLTRFQEGWKVTSRDACKTMRSVQSRAGTDKLRAGNGTGTAASLKPDLESSLCVLQVGHRFALRLGGAFDCGLSLELPRAFGDYCDTIHPKKEGPISTCAQSPIHGAHTCHWWRLWPEAPPCCFQGTRPAP